MIAGQSSPVKDQFHSVDDVATVSADRTPRPQPPRSGGTVMVLAAALLWGTIGPAHAAAASPLGTAAVGAWRQLVGGAVLGVASLVVPGAVRSIARHAIWPAMVAAGVCSAAYQASFMASVARSGAAVGTVVACAAVPFCTGLITRYTDGVRLDRGWAIGSTVAVVGCTVLLLPGGSAHLDVVGLAMGVLGGMCFSLYTAVARWLVTQRVHVLAATAGSLLVGALILLPWLIHDLADVRHARSIALVGWLGVAATAVAYALYSRGLRQVNARTAGALSLSEPVAAVAVSLVILGAPLSAAELAGSVLTVVGLAVACRRREVRVPRGQPSGSSRFGHQTRGPMS